MSTLHRYFLRDFQGISGKRKVLLKIPNEDDEFVDFYVHEHIISDLKGATKLFAYFIPSNPNVLKVCELLINEFENRKKISDFKTFESFEGDILLGKSKSNIFSDRIYFYTESDLNKEELKNLEKKAIEKEVFLTIRSNEYLYIKLQMETPLAFISHDSIDKELIAKPLATGLSSRLCPVWYDEFSMNVGDSLRESIEKGIREAKKCILVLTPNFLKNTGWTKKEFNSIFTREMIKDERIVLPIWYKVTKNDVYNYSPSLVDTVALIWPDKDSLDEKEYNKQVEILISKIHAAISNS